MCLVVCAHCDAGVSYMIQRLSGVCSCRGVGVHFFVVVIDFRCDLYVGDERRNCLWASSYSARDDGRLRGVGAKRGLYWGEMCVFFAVVWLRFRSAPSSE